MKPIFAIVAALLLVQSMWAQNPPPSANVTRERPDVTRVNAQTANIAPAAEAVPGPDAFDLNFPGGGPRALVTAIEKASGKPLNVIIPREFEDVDLPPMRFTKVTVPALFDALSSSSRHTVHAPNGSYSASYGFVTKRPDENAVWWFSCDRPPKPEEIKKYCQFYQLDEILGNYSIEDITTAIQTGWKMLGVSPTPELKFHPETKLLIAVGQPENLQTITSVLNALSKSSADARANNPKREVSPPK